jgi:hypothetical protein
VKKVLMFLAILVLLIVVLFAGLMFYSIYIGSKEPVASVPAIPPTITYTIEIPSSNGLDGKQTVFKGDISFEPIIEFFGEAFPVKILSTAALNTFPDGSSRMVNEDDYIGDWLGDFGVTFYIKRSSEEASDGEVPLRIEIEGDRFIRKSSMDVFVPQDKEIEIFPRIVYDYNALERLVQPASENVYFRLFYGSVKLIEKSEIVRFHSVNEIPFYVASRWDEDRIVDNTDYFAAYVNEDDPLIDKILQEALQIGTAEKIGYGDGFSFSGYQRKDADGDSSLSVDLQVLAVWSVFLKHNIKYSNITTTSTANGKINTQYVRTLSESFGNAQANCVDGSVLFASVLRKIGIEPCLIILPGHMLIAYFRNEDYSYESIAFLETTMLGSVDISKYTKNESIWGKIKDIFGGKTQASVTRDSFLAALAAGAETIEETEADDITVVDIAACRSFGIMPIVRQ